ncbi:hypothetical protein [Actinocatenispora rupis]|uniref:Uncharacterized protein n=1 Tax=Actinocatenispora rupis TaxID=519421 RepID=A0A8J3ND00_9ACTN|nr:hypothetical protein [Actinocatenispora rupis]GID12425.1 hypothetical protein Aru02nite_33140 [Actinocatenispora rupis]
MTIAVTALLRLVDANDADVDNARHLLSHHYPDGTGVCPRCRSRYPCVPRRIAETLLRTAASR